MQKERTVAGGQCSHSAGPGPGFALDSTRDASSAAQDARATPLAPPCPFPRASASAGGGSNRPSPACPPLGAESRTASAAAADGAAAAVANGAAGGDAGPRPQVRAARTSRPSRVNTLAGWKSHRDPARMPSGLACACAASGGGPTRAGGQPHTGGALGASGRARAASSRGVARAGGGQADAGVANMIQGMRPSRSMLAPAPVPVPRAAAPHVAVPPLPLSLPDATVF